MTARVLLIDPPYLGRGARWWDHVGARMPGLGLPSLAAWLERSGHRVDLVDCTAEGIGPEDLRARVGGLRPDVVGLTAMTPVVPAALAAARTCRRLFPGARIVVGGTHATVRPEDLLAGDAVDAVVRGEGEIPLERLVDGASVEELTGVSYRGDGGVVHNPECTPIDDLDDLPLPAYHLLDLRRYRPGLGTYRRLPAMCLVTTRGCAHHCTYCFNLFGHRPRRRSAERILDDVRQLRRRFGIRQLLFYDDAFTVHRDRLRAFCQGLLRDGARVSWTCYGRVDAVRADLLSLMARAGCHQICYGIESGSQRVLDSVDKRITLEQVRRAVRLTREAGIEPRGSFMLGNRGETARTMLQTIDLALSLDLEVALFSVATPYPGTALYDWAEREGLLTTRDWADYDRAHTVLRLPTVDPDTVWAHHRLAYRRFYLRPRYLLHRGARLRTLRHLRDAARVLAAVWRYGADGPAVPSPPAPPR